MSNKDVGLRIRVERTLREDFVEVRRSQDKPAAQVLREFMRDYVERHKDEQQRGPFESTLASRPQGEMR